MPKVQPRPAEPPPGDTMTEDEFIAEMIAAEDRFLRSLKRSKKGYLWCLTEWGEVVSVFRQWDKWRWSLKAGEDDEVEFSPRTYKTEEAAVSALWERVYGV